MSVALAVSNKVVPKPKTVVQTRSEVDLLDDGFKLRNYGRKVIRGMLIQGDLYILGYLFGLLTSGTYTIVQFGYMKFSNVQELL